MDQYLTVATITESGSMNKRVAACAATEGVQGDPTQWAYDNRFGWASAPGWAAAWDSADASGIDDPGADPAVITDAQILSQLQAMAAAL
jgi:hypothetical protein